MGYIEGQSREQVTIFPDTVDEYIAENNAVRVIDIFVENLDLDNANFTKAIPAKEGRPSYNPKDLLKLYIYGYFNKIRSSRKLMTECHRNVELMWLLRKLTPDFRTISDFRKDNAKALKNVFKAFVKLCLEMNLYVKELVAIDGSKFKAVNSKDKNYTKSMLDKRLKRIDENIADFINEMDKCDKNDCNEPEITKEQLKRKISQLSKSKDLCNSYLEEMKENNTTQKSLTDPESKLMKNNKGFDVCYNVQTAVDNKSHLIADFIITNNCNDIGLLVPMAEAAKEALEVETLEVVADKGYRMHADVMESLKNGIIPNVYLFDKQENYSFEIDFKENEITEEIRNSAAPENIQKCFESGVIPDIYESCQISAEIIECKDVTVEKNESFSRNRETNTVICPMGYTLKQKAICANKKRYANKLACKSCINKCTTAKFKVVAFPENKDFVESRFFEEKYKLMKSSDVCSSKMKVRITFIPDKSKLRLRKCIVEHPFGSIKRWSDGSYLLLKGKVKTTAELSLSFLAYNIKRAINMVGVNNLIAKMQAI